MKTKARPLRLGAVLARPDKLVSRLILADLIAKRGEGALERRRLVYQRPRKR